MEMKKLNQVNAVRVIAQSSRGTTNAHTKHQYGITLEKYKECMNTSSICESCGSPINLCYDHDHTTMEFRGVLCNKCNIGIGLLGDNINGVRNALDYLEKD